MSKQFNALFVYQLKRQLKRHRITQDRLADEANVVRITVCNVLNGRGTSSNVINTALRLLQEAKHEP